MFQMTLFIQFPYFAEIKRTEIEDIVKVNNLINCTANILYIHLY
jgi:hypothetical protein